MTSALIDMDEIRANFDNEVRLFPLPNLVLFPDGVAPMRMFERRYVALTADAIEDDGLIATALLKPGWDEGDLYKGNPPIFPVVTVGKILRHEKGPTGQYQILLYGLFRARVEAEIPHEPYRRARVLPLDDIATHDDASAIAQRMQRALELVPGKQSMIWEMRRMSNQLRGIDARAGRYADAVANASDLSPDDRYQLLAEPNVLERFDRLIRLLEARAYSDGPDIAPGTEPSLN